ncbi:helix-turn-helix transcriptional regulator [Streptomyces sp. NPDC005799]|uniref:helix-turn-helix domain-containing protein n=1 Tax=Streptomyces sp. NPDC005799 TaxID=3154678 RepID=UPI0033DFC59F
MRPNGDAMKAIRKARGIGLRRLAEAIGIDPGYLSRIENGKQGAGAGTLHRYADELDVPVQAITHEEAPRGHE